MYADLFNHETFAWHKINEIRKQNKTLSSKNDRQQKLPQISIPTFFTTVFNYFRQTFRTKCPPVRYTQYHSRTLS